jgi:integrase
MNGKLNQANGRLKAANVGVAILQRGERLYLRATFPPKPDSTKEFPYQQEISLGVQASPAGVQYAEKEARKVGALLACKEFAWESYLRRSREHPATVGDWISRFEAEFRGSMESVTWKTDYQNVFKRLESSETLTVDLLKSVISETKPNTKTRRRFCLALGKLAKLAGLEGDFKNLQGNYSAKAVNPRDLPDDGAIAEQYYRISDPGWRWVYGVIATFGLRNHEAFFLDTEALQRGEYLVTVLESKSNRWHKKQRLVWACYPEWVEQFNLRAPILPDVSGSDHADYGSRVSNFFGREEIPFACYNLRHRWAVRTLEFGLDISLAAQQMGHSVKVHSETYHRWITADVHQRAFEALMMRCDRPRPPLLQEIV